MKLITNPYRLRGIPCLPITPDNKVSGDVASVLKLLNACPVASPTPLVSAETLALKHTVASIAIKDERKRMGLGSFKSLGATYAIAKAAVAANKGQVGSPEQMATSLNGVVYVTASAGNHGVSTAAGARIFGAKAVIYLSETVPSGFADRLRRFGAQVVIEGAHYEASNEAAMAASVRYGWTLLSDSTWDGYNGGRDIMEGYLAMPAEAAKQIVEEPTHIFLQAGVGGLAAAAARHARDTWGNRPVICVVEPTAAPALMAAIEAGEVVHASGPVSSMGRLDCKEASLLALECLSREADAFLTLNDDYVQETIQQLSAESLDTSPSGGAGYAGFCAARAANKLGLNESSRILIYLSEGLADD